MASLLSVQAASAAPVDNKEIPSFNSFGGITSVPGNFASVGIDPTDATKLIVTQDAARAVINWNTFNIGKNASATFTAANSSQITVNRVVGPQNDPSKIYGTLTANNRIFILDKNGVVFGKNATIDVGGLIASTGDLADIGAFVDGTGSFVLQNVDANPAAAIENNATINVADSGLLAFVAPYVHNSGTINAKLGKVTLASGSKVTVDLTGDNLISIAPDDKVQKGLVELTSKGKINANGGVVTMTANVAKNVVDTVINMDGVITANKFSSHNGKIVLSSTGGGKVEVNDNLIASNAPASADLANPDISVSGYDVYVGSSGNLVAAADGSAGNGGAVRIWADNKVIFQGKIDVSAGSSSGNGGKAEISARNAVGYYGVTDASAPHGTMGALLIDPALVKIGNSTSTFDPVVNAAALAETLGLSNVSILAGDKIVLVDDVNLARWCMGPACLATGDLTLDAPTLDLVHDMKMGLGDLILDADTINLDGRILNKDGNILDKARIASAAALVNVLSNNAKIQQGIDVAGKDATVYVASGYYAENIDIYKSLTLQGDGSMPILAGITEDGTVVLVSANNVTVDGFEIVGKFLGTGNGTGNPHDEGQTGDPHNDGEHGNPHDQGLPPADSAYGIFADGVSNLTVSGNNIHDLTQNAIRIDNSHDVLISGNTVTSTGDDGIQITGSRRILIEQNTVRNAGDDGIDADGVRHLDILGNIVEDVDANGIEVTDSHKVEIGFNTIGGTGNDGVSVKHAKKVLIALNEIEAAGGDGIDVRDVYKADIYSNRVAVTGDSGIEVSKANDVNIGSNKVKFTSGDGIDVQQVDDISIFDNKVKFIGDDGIDVRGGHNVSITDNDVLFIYNNGIEVTRVRGDATIEDNQIGLTGEDGIQTEDVRNLSIAHNLVFLTGDDGIDANGSHHADIHGNSTGYTNGDGIQVTGSRRVLIEQNTVRNAGDDGIDADGVRHLDILGNTVENVDANGIEVTDSHKVEIGFNTIGDAGYETTMFGPAEYEGDYGDSEVSGAGEDGIHVENSHRVAIYANGVAGSGDDGIDVSEGCRVDINENNVSDSSDNGIVVNDSSRVGIDANIVANSGSTIWDWWWGYSTGDGIRAENVEGLSITGNEIYSSKVNGISVDDSSDVAVHDNGIFGTGSWDWWSWYNGDGIRAENIEGLSITGNEIYGTMDDGIDVVNTFGGLISGNFVAETNDTGISLWNSASSLVTGNTLEYVQNGVIANFSPDTVISANTITGNSDTGIGVWFGNGTTIADNTVSHFYNGIQVYFSNLVDILDNAVSEIWNDGVQVGYSNGVHIIGNTITNYMDDGIQVAYSGFGYNEESRSFSEDDYSEEGDVEEYFDPRIVISNNTINGAFSSGEEGEGDYEARFYEDEIVSGNASSGIRLWDNGEFRDKGESEFSIARIDFPDFGIMSGNGTVDILGNTISNNQVGLDARAFNNDNINIAGNGFIDNFVGAWLASGLIDLTGETNTFTGGDVALRFERAQGGYYPQYEQNFFFDEEYDETPYMPEYAYLELVDDTIGTTIFDGQSTYYIELLQGAFFDPGRPTIIDGTLATYDGVSGGSMTAAQLAAIEQMINDYDDNTSLGQIFAGYVPGDINDSLLLRRIAASKFRPGRSGITILGLPSTNGGGPTGLSIQDLANLAPAAGGDDGELSVEDLANLAPAAGGDGTGIVDGHCWSKIGQHLGGTYAVNMNLDGDPSSILADAEACED